ncbi:hypothetical protein GTU71_13795 [Rathayibacter sp. VKM Ac-2762]|uniref:hypothetical protein n=1 Tax=Rathayibacter sp. VKM Ac-2762 TaxID=2609254 RepID=UPI00132EFA2F|nr:hypothetical protein [Rathayibacter sp. VKM Ac-2762]QHF21803.1 hypothetical protein GTU71_13795 [Rathayibacter sp. VKM Ac-2762]
MGRIRFSSPGWDEDTDRGPAPDPDRGRYSRDDGARFTAIALTCLSVLPAIVLTAAFLLVRLPPLDRDDQPDWTAPAADVLAPWLLLFLLPPLVTGLLARLVGGRDSSHGFGRSAAVCLVVMAPFLGLSALSLLG